MQTTEPKTVGEVFDLLLPADDGAEIKTGLYEAARTATSAENELWMLWRKHDPVTALDKMAMRQVKQQTGKWPKLPDYRLEQVPEGPTPCKIAGALCPDLYSYVYDAVANSVARLYRKGRFAYLTFQKRLPIGRDLRIRFRERAVAIRRDPANDKFFQAGLSLRRGQTWWCGLKAVGKSRHTYDWLAELAEKGENPSGGTISLRRRRGKRTWQISLARTRRDGERERVTDPIEGRDLIVWAPLDQAAFLYCQVEPVNGRPWRYTVESADLIRVKQRHQNHRRSMGRNYHQSPHSAAHGHGRKRAIAAKLSFAERYERRVKDWIENRSTAVVRFAVQCRCRRVRVENLTGRNPETLCLGSFPYFRLLERIANKCKDAGLGFAKLPDLDSVRKLLSAEE